MRPEGWLLDVVARFNRMAIVALLVCLAVPWMARADDWPQWLGPRRDGVWRETGILATFSKEGARIRWRTPVGGGYAGPAVTGGRVYLLDRVLPGGARNPANAFATSTIPGRERVVCLDEATGKVLWKHDYRCPYNISYPAGPRPPRWCTAARFTPWVRWATCSAWMPPPVPSCGRITCRANTRLACRSGVTPPTRFSIATGSSASWAAREAWPSPFTKTPAKSCGAA